ncbi:alpha-L-rhamnosidase [Paenibacillus sp. OK060]|uniref:glycosyl hydrolase n=1 Tax=Paenibacillus sp. OK060 TaxID=1881034 RepID=UPI00088E17CD|nr:glycosyl hydrolase [Paenibacillus sp. OK060]SDK46222.1 alpha-L-rhamnosidase [Paenibacillus sp. OK060]
MTIWDLLQNPPADYRTVPFWSWNDDLDHNELVRQIEEMHSAGIGGFFIHARGGLTVPYMGKEWMEAIQICIKKSQELGMETWLYDENGWPSGFADGKVPALGVAYQQKRLAYEWAPFNRGNRVTIASYVQSEEELHLLTTGDTRKPDFRVYYELNPYYIDTLSKKAVAAFIDSTYNAYWAEFGEQFGSVLKGIFTDEPQFGRGDLPWSLELEDAFQNQHGYSLRKVIPALFLETKDCRRVRYDYWSCVTTLFTESYAKQIGEWCEQRGWLATGHVVDEQTLMSQATSVGDPLLFYEYLQIPGCDWLGRSVSEEPVVPKQVSSVVRQLGKKQAITESYGCSGWNVSFQDLKRIGEWQFVHGMNLMCQHLQAYTLRGLRKRDYPPSLFYQQPWWRYYYHFNDYFARLSMLLVEGVRQAEVLLLHPIRTAWVELEGSNSSQVEQYHESFAQLSRWLCQSFIEHDYGSEGIIERHGRVEGNLFVVGEIGYRVVVVPPSVTLSEMTVKLLHQFVFHGGSLVVLEPVPFLINGQPGEEIRRLVNGAVKPDWNRNALVESVSRTVSPSIAIVDREGLPIVSDMVNIQTLKLEDSYLYYLVNSGEKCYPDVEVTLPRRGILSLIDLESGDIRPLNYTRVGNGVKLNMTLYPTQSYVIKLVPTKGQLETDEVTLLQTDNSARFIQELSELWEIDHIDHNSLTMDTCRYRLENGDWSEPKPIIFIQEELLQIGYPVQVELEFEFQIAFDPALVREMHLVMENPEKVQILINDSKIASHSCDWWRDVSFKKIDLSGFLQHGRNTIRLTLDFWNSAETYAAIERAQSFESEGNKLKFDTELESVYLVGHFAVKSESPYKNGEHGVIYTDGPFILEELPHQYSLITDLGCQGLPFFAGSIQLVQKVAIHFEDSVSRVWQFGSHPNAIVTRLSINGQEVRTFLWEPYEADISEYLQQGENLIELELTSSCRNLLGPHHHVKGEPMKVGPDSFKNRVGWMDRDLDPDINLYQSHYAFVRFGLSTLPRIVMMT